MVQMYQMMQLLYKSRLQTQGQGGTLVATGFNPYTTGPLSLSLCVHSKF